MKKMIKVLACSGLFMLLTACGSKLTVAVKEGIVIEYGSELSIENVTDQEGITIKEIKDFDSKKIGEQKVTILFADAEENEAEQEITIEVKDTKAPEITLKEETMTLTEDDPFDPVSNIESVKDVIDGDIQKSDDQEITQNGYIINSDVDNTKAGDYTVTITAYDVNGNKSESSYKVTVKEKEEEVQAPASNSQPQSQGSSVLPQSNQGTPNNNGSQQPAPSLPTQEPTCRVGVPSARDLETGSILFDDLDEAKAWGHAYVAERDEAEMRGEDVRPIVSFSCIQVADECGNPMNMWRLYYNYGNNEYDYK